MATKDQKKIRLKKIKQQQKLNREKNKALFNSEEKQQGMQIIEKQEKVKKSLYTFQCTMDSYRLTEDNNKCLRGFVQEKMLRIMKLSESKDNAESIYDIASLVSRYVKHPEEAKNSEKYSYISGNVNLNNTERMVIIQELRSIILEFEEKKHGLQAIDYGAIRVISQLVFQIVRIGLENRKIKHIKYKVAYNDVLTEYSVEYKTSCSSYNMRNEEFISTIWKAESEVYNKYNTYKTEYKNFEEESLRLLVSSYELISFYNKKEEAKEFISYSTVAMNYLVVLEKEIKKLISIRSEGKIKVKNLVDAINYLREYDQYNVFTEELIDELHKLRLLRNIAAHGGVITRIQCEQIISVLLDGSVYDYISWSMEDNHGKGLPKEKGLTLNIGEENGKLKLINNSYFNETEEHDRIKKLIVLAKSGDSQAQFELGNSYVKGEGVKQNLIEAVKWLELAALQNHTKAQLHLGDLYYFGEFVKKDYKKAYKWIRLSAEAGNVDAQFYMGDMFRYGKGVKKNNEEAYKWYMLAAEQGDAESQHNVAVMNIKGEGTNINTKEGALWAMKAAEKNFAKAQALLGNLYDSGKGVEKDYEQSVKWYKIAAENGNTDAQYILGCMYHESSLYITALKYYKMAAEQNVVEAQINVAKMYYLGQGAKRDFSEALFWLNLAVEQNSNEAKKLRDKILSSFN